LEKAAKIIEKRIEGETRHPNGSRFGVLTLFVSRRIKQLKKIKRFMLSNKTYFVGRYQLKNNAQCFTAIA